MELQRLYGMYYVTANGAQDTRCDLLAASNDLDKLHKICPEITFSVNSTEGVFCQYTNDRKLPYFHFKEIPYVC